MEVGFSKDISLFQLNEHPKPKLMFNKNYPFFTSSSKYMVKHFNDYSKWIKKYYFKNTKNIIEIGSNDGTFLKNFKSSKINILGIEPSKNVASVAKKNKINTINKFFNLKTAKSLKRFTNKTDLICAANAICHIPNLRDLIKGINTLLSKKGVFIFEEPYLGSMYEKTSYDQIYDEHIFIFSISSVKKIFNLFDLQLIDVQKQDTHGGSMRYVIARRGEYKIKKTVQKGLSYEKKNNIDNLKGCLKFKRNCEISKRKLKNKIISIKKRNKSIAGYAATSKSTTILNYCGIDKRHIDFICDTTVNKIGKFTPKTHIPIVNVDYLEKKSQIINFYLPGITKKKFLKKKRNI